MSIDLVTIIVIVTSIISIAAFADRNLMARLINRPYDIKRYNQWYRLLTSGFLHADWIHLLFNMYVLYNFGKNVLNDYHSLWYSKGTWYFLILYIGGILVSDLPTYKKHQDDPAYASLGASGAVSAVLFAFVFLHPTTTLIMFPLPIPLPAVLLGAGYLIYSWYMARRGGDFINHSAHFTGAVFGILYTFILRPSLVSRFIDQILDLIHSVL